MFVQELSDSVYYAFLSFVSDVCSLFYIKIKIIFNVPRVKPYKDFLFVQLDLLQLDV